MAQNNYSGPLECVTVDSMRHIRGTMRTVNDGLGYWPVMRLLEAGLAGQGMLPRTFHLGERAFGFAERKAARLQLLLADCEY